MQLSQLFTRAKHYQRLLQLSGTPNFKIAEEVSAYIVESTTDLNSYSWRNLKGKPNESSQRVTE